MTRRQGEECQVLPMFCRTRRTRPFFPVTGSEKKVPGKIARARRPSRVGFAGSSPFFVFLWNFRKMSKFISRSPQRTPNPPSEGGTLLWSSLSFLGEGLHGRVDDRLRGDRRAARGVHAL